MQLRLENRSLHQIESCAVGSTVSQSTRHPIQPELIRSSASLPGLMLAPAIRWSAAAQGWPYRAGEPACPKISTQASIRTL
jgi:hypothetical protein